MDLIIKDTKADFNEYFDICNASDETKEKFETKDFLVVPSKYQDKEYYFAQETIDFIKYCRLNDAEHAKKMMRIGTSRVFNLTKEQLIEKINTLPRWHDKFSVNKNTNQIILNTNGEVESLIDLFDERYTRSDVTDTEYDTDVKTVAQPMKD